MTMSTDNQIPTKDATTTEQPVETKIVTAPEQDGRGEVSAATIGMMLGLASSNELKLMESKIDLFGQKITTMAVRMDKVLAALQQLPTGSDLERIDVQIGGLKSMIRDVLGQMVSRAGDVPKSGADSGKAAGPKIQTNTEPAKS